jgi:hypothetical protein
MPPVPHDVTDEEIRDAGNGDVRNIDVSVGFTITRSIDRGRHV